MQHKNKKCFKGRFHCIHVWNPQGIKFIFTFPKGDYGRKRHVSFDNTVQEFQWPLTLGPTFPFQFLFLLSLLLGPQCIWMPICFAHWWIAKISYSFLAVQDKAQFVSASLAMETLQFASEHHRFLEDLPPAKSRFIPWMIYPTDYFMRM